jgi:hypothetical protein
MRDQEIAARAEMAVIAPLPETDRRGGWRVKIARLILARPSNPSYKEEVETALNASHDGLYFTTKAQHYYVGMRLSVTSLHAVPSNSVSFGEVVRIDRLKDGGSGIAVRILLR